MQIANTILSSIYLDYKMFSLNFFTLPEILEFFFKKYFLVIKHIFIKFEFGKSYIYIFKNKYFYESPLGLAFIQSMYVHHLQALLTVKDKSIETVVDVGANIGNFTLLTNKVFGPKKIYSFEPIPLTFKSLEKNCKKLKNVELQNTALSNNIGKALMDFSVNESDVSRFTGDTEIKNEKSTIEVDTLTLDEFVKSKRIPKIDLLKIDVESFENLVLEGSKSSLKNVRYLFIEITIKNNRNYTISSLLSLLYGSGYNFQLIYYRNVLKKSYGSIEWMDCLFENISYKN